MCVLYSLQSVVRHTHYMPERWRGRGAMRETYLEFICLFQYQLVLLMQARPWPQLQPLAPAPGPALSLTSGH